MRVRKLILRLMATGTACLLVSCIDGREEVWLNADGSGRSDVTYSIPALAANFQGGESGVRKMLADFLVRTPALKNPVYDVTTTDTRMTIRVQASFDSALELKEISEGDSMQQLPAAAAGLTGSTSLNLNGRTVDFSRTIDAGSALPGSSFMPDNQFSGHRLSYIIHLPQAAVESNATRTDNGGRTLIWDIPLAQAIAGPVTTKFKAKVPIPWWVLVSAGAVTIATGALVISKFKKPRRAQS